MTSTVDTTLWLDVLKKIEPQLQRSQFITWFKDTTILGREKDTVVVGLPLPMFLNWHLEHYRAMTLNELRSIDPAIEQIVYQVDVGLKDDPQRTINILDHFPEKKKARKLPNKAEVKLAEGITSKLLNPRYTLENFVVGADNRLAHAACLAVSMQPGGKYNPLFLYGGVGLGKTHLLQAVGNAILKTIHNAAILYTTSEQFTNEVVEAISHQRMEQFRRRYRDVDVFIIDDVQFLANKERTQEELFHTFNTLTEERKQVIISADRPPKELNMMQDRLVSRFERGMVADVGRPDYETRLAILLEKAKEFQLFIDAQVLQYIAEHADKNVRQLEGILMQAVAQYELEQRMPTVSSIAEIMGKLVADTSLPKQEVGFVNKPQQKATFQDVLECVSKFYSVSIPEMIGQSRVREILIPRQIVMYLGKEYLRMSYVSLGTSFSNRDHTTVMNAVDRIVKRMHEDPQLLREVRAIEREVGLGQK